MFIDADVRLEPEAMARMANLIAESRADLVSGIPRQETRTFSEKLLIPLIHFVLLGFLPIGWMRRSRHPAFGAGCGQCFVVGLEAYAFAGGHAAIRTSMHDGITLPRAFRRRGLVTDLYDVTDLAVCRMYTGWREVWLGLSKNAHEGLGRPAALLPWTAFLVGGQVLPVFILLCAAWLPPPGRWFAGTAVLLAYAPRIHAAVRFRQSWLGAVLHPLGVAALLAIQWYALGRAVCGRPVGWKGRPNSAANLHGVGAHIRDGPSQPPVEQLPRSGNRF